MKHGTQGVSSRPLHPRNQAHLVIVQSVGLLVEEAVSALQHRNADCQPLLDHLGGGQVRASGRGTGRRSRGSGEGSPTDQQRGFGQGREPLQDHQWRRAEARVRQCSARPRKDRAPAGALPFPPLCAGPPLPCDCKSPVPSTPYPPTTHTHLGDEFPQRHGLRVDTQVELGLAARHASGAGCVGLHGLDHALSRDLLSEEGAAV